MKKLALPLLTAAALATAALPSARAAVTLAGNFQTGSPRPSLSITTPITITIGSGTTTLRGLAFDEWAPNDGSSDVASPFNNQTITYQVNGGQQFAVGLSGFYDHANSTLGGITANDGFLYFSSPLSVSAGQTVTFPVQTLLLSGGGSTFDPNLPNPYNGPVYGFDGNFARASVNTPARSPAPGRCWAWARRAWPWRAAAAPGGREVGSPPPRARGICRGWRDGVVACNVLNSRPLPRQPAGKGLSVIPQRKTTLPSFIYP